MGGGGGGTTFYTPWQKKKENVKVDLTAESCKIDIWSLKLSISKITYEESKMHRLTKIFLTLDGQFQGYPHLNR